MKKTLFVMLLTVAIALSVTVISCSSEVKVQPASTDDYVCFTAKAANSHIVMQNSNDVEKFPLFLEYKTNNDWVTYTTGTIITLANIDDKVYFRAKEEGNKYFCLHENENDYYWCFFVSNGSVDVSGNIKYLLDQDANVTTLSDYCFAHLFADSTGIVSAKELSLPAEMLSTACFKEMFSGCENLTKAPELPATTLATRCYESMFMNCTSLDNAPALSATTLADHCYTSMFSGCKKLEEAPKLPATTLTDYCYNEMFYNCTSLTDAPVLSATDLARDCYSAMFFGCTSLTKAPALPATTLTDYCYEDMFANCSKLKVGKTTASTYNGTKIFACPNDIPYHSVMGMFTGTGGSCTSDPTSGNTYYWY